MQCSRICAEDGHETFRDPATGQPTDVRPAEAAWLSLWDEEYEHEYFFNELTNVRGFMLRFAALACLRGRRACSAQVSVCMMSLQL